MSISSVVFIPELNYYFGEFVRNTKLNKYQIKSPASFLESIITPKSFIELLFNDSWPSIYTDYIYCYRQETSQSAWPSSIKNRINLYSNSSQYYVLADSNESGIDSTSSNIFLLQQDDLTMLDKLLEYRLDGTSVTIADIDSTALTTNLSILIYQYLDLKINNNYQAYNNTVLIADQSKILEVMYEEYVIENMFNYVSERGS